MPGSWVQGEADLPVAGPLYGVHHRAGPRGRDDRVERTLEGPDRERAKGPAHLWGLPLAAHRQHRGKGRGMCRGEAPATGSPHGNAGEVEAVRVTVVRPHYLLQRLEREFISRPSARSRSAGEKRLPCPGSPDECNIRQVPETCQGNISSASPQTAGRRGSLTQTLPMTSTSASSTIRIAFAGFRHGHIHSLYHAARARPDVEIVAAAEEDEPTRHALQGGGTIHITHSSIASMLDAVPCDVVAVGDYYGRRGALLIEALRRRKHVISDKPICTSLAELDQIEALAREQGRVVGCQLDMRDAPVALEARRRLLGGEIGAVHAVQVGGQHPLLFGTRPGWYFERGKHGGTINDIGIHALDALPWMTGLRFREITFARAWNARLPQEPHFQDGAQFALVMSNGAGVLADVSYLGPDANGYRIPQYWRMTFWGSEGLLETDFPAGQVTIHPQHDPAPQVIQAAAGVPGGYLDSFLRELRGETSGLHLSSAEVLAASRLALRTQEAADQGLFRVPLG